MVEGVGFVIAGRLALGNAIVTRAGPALTVAKIEWKQSKQPVALYNFEVEDDHSYFVGSANGGLWVHNPGSCFQLHHVYPQEFAETWAEKGIAHHDYTNSVPTEFHQKWLHGWKGENGNAGLSAAEMFGAAAPAVGALGQVGAARAVEKELTSGQPLFRVMSDPEAYDLLEKGQFAPSPSGSIGKYFWGTQEAAEKWQAYNWYGKSSSIIRTGISDTSLLDGPNSMDSIDGAYVLANEYLSKLWPHTWLK